MVLNEDHYVGPSATAPASTARAEILDGSWTFPPIAVAA
jgi:hypothetical protein